MVHLWSLQTVYEGNDWMVPRNKWEGEERCQICMGVVAHSYECTHPSRKKGTKKPERMVLYFFSSDIPGLVIQVLGTVSRCKHKLPKTGLVFPPEGCIFLLGGRKTCYKRRNRVDMLTFLAH